MNLNDEFGGKFTRSKERRDRKDAEWAHCPLSQISVIGPTRFFDHWMKVNRWLSWPHSTPRPANLRLLTEATDRDDTLSRTRTLPILKYSIRLPYSMIHRSTNLLLFSFVHCYFFFFLNEIEGKKLWKSDHFCDFFIYILDVFRWYWIYKLY